MIRCREEVIERNTEKKDIERLARPFVALRRLDFATLWARDGARWECCHSAEQLARVADRARKELVPADYPRFVNHLCAVYGVGLVRAAGLPITRIQLAS